MLNTNKTDGALLTEFLEPQLGPKREAAFEELVRRHSGLIYGVCSRILVTQEDAEDAAQAVLLTLAHKAAELRKHPTLSGWLYHTARQIALRQKESSTRRKERERKAAQMNTFSSPTSTENNEQDWQHLSPVLDEELSALPDKYRLPILLHHVEGLTQEEAAKLLGCSYGTLSGRLSRAREILQKRLERRGVALSIGIIPGLLSQHANLPMSEVLVKSSTQAAMKIVSGQALGTSTVSAKAAALSKGALQKMFYAKLKMAAMVAACVTVIGALAGWEVYQLHAEEAVAPVKNPPVVMGQKEVHNSPVAAPAPAAVAVAKPADNPQPKDDKTVKADKPALTAAQLKECVAMLESPDEKIRVKAIKDLREAGESARAALEKGAQSNIADVKSRSTTLLGVLKTTPIIEKAVAACKSVNLNCEADMKIDFSDNMRGEIEKGIGHVKYRQTKVQTYSAMTLATNLTEEMQVLNICDGKNTWIEKYRGSTGPPDKGGIKGVMKYSVDSPDMKTMEGNYKNPMLFDKDEIDSYDFVEMYESNIDGIPVYVFSGKLREDVLGERVAMATAIGWNGWCEKSWTAQMEKAFIETTSKRISIGKEDFLLRKLETLDADGKIIGLIQLSNLKINVVFEDSVFTYCPPAGVQIFDGAEAAKQRKKSIQSLSRRATDGPHAKDNF